MSGVRFVFPRRERHQSVDADEGSMMLFLLVMLAIGALLSVMLVNSVAASKTARHDANFTQAFPGADKNVSLAQSYLNTNQAGNLVTTAPSPTAPTGWYATQNSPLAYTVTSWNTTNGVKRTVSAQISQKTLFNFAAFADVGVTLRGSNGATSYDHRNGNVAATGDGVVGSNGSITFTGNATADGAMLSDWLANPTTSRCTGGPCSGWTSSASPPPSVSPVPDKQDISSASATQFVTDQLTTCTSTTAWVASQHNGVLDAGTYCFSSMTFDVDTIVNGTVKAYLGTSGTVSVSNGVDINFNGTYSDATKLQIYDLGPTVYIGNHVNFGAALWAPLADCGGAPSNAQTDMWGSAVCKTISNQGGWQFHYDDALSSLGSGSWNISHYAEN